MTTADIAAPAAASLTIGEVAAIQQRSVHAVYCRLSAGTMLPAPIADHPYRWSRADLDRWLRGEFREAEATLRRKARRRAALTVVR